MDMDSTLAVLADDTRRAVIRALAGEADIGDGAVSPDGGVEIHVDTLCCPATGARKADLHHRHLPKLDAARVIDWDQERGEIHPGPAFDHVIGVLTAIDGRTART